MPGRSYILGGYRYGFNGKENDDEVKGEGNQQDYGMRIYDSRVGRFLSVDPLTKNYPELTPYQIASNSPIINIDLDGLEGVKVTDAAKKTITIVVNVFYILNSQYKHAEGSMNEKQLARVESNLNAELNKHSFKDQITGYDVIFNVTFSAGNPNDKSHKEDSYDIQDPSMYINMQDEKVVDTKTGHDDSGNEVKFQIVKRGASSWRILNITNSRNGHTIAHELFHDLTHNHKNAPEDIRNQIDLKDQTPGHKLAGGIFVYADESNRIEVENINQQNIQNVLRSLPEKNNAPSSTPSSDSPFTDNDNPDAGKWERN